MIEDGEMMAEKVCVVGLGYVGLPLVLALGAKFRCVAFDIDENRIAKLANNVDENKEHKSSEFENIDVHFTSTITAAVDCTTFIVTVPTPINEDKTPNLEPLRGACNALGPVLKRGDLVIFESTVFPGCTEDFCGPILSQASGLELFSEIKLGYSPERINPGDKTNTIETIMKVVSGCDAETRDRVVNIYGSIIRAGLHMAESIRVAEASKITENIQRDVNIALMNELSNVFSGLGVRTSHVLAAAGTKWNFIPFKPGLVGGHCIGVDPYYLISAASKKGLDHSLLSAARNVNEGMVPRIIRQYRKKAKKKHGRVLVMGLSFKENCNDLRNSKPLELAIALSDETEVHAIEPNITQLSGTRIELVDDFSHGPYDCVIIAVRHNQFKFLGKDIFAELVDNDGYIFDLHDIYGLEQEVGGWL